MPEHITMRTAAGELGLTPPQLELARQLGEVRTVRGGGGAETGGAARGEGTVRVPREEVDRLRSQSGFPQSLRRRLTVVGPAKGAELLGIAPTRFTRLARGGCFSPVRFYVNRYRAVVWLYLAAELYAFAGRRPELLRGNAPRGLRMLLGEGTDLRPMHWRGRWVEQFSRQAAGPWGRAAARAAVLDESTVEATVPDAGERARLRALRPELLTTGYGTVATREVAERLGVADAEDEVFLHRLLLAAELDEARAADARDVALLSAQAASGAGQFGGSAADGAEEMPVPPRSVPVSVSVPEPASESVRVSVPLPPPAAVQTAVPAELSAEGSPRSLTLAAAPDLSARVGVREHEEGDPSPSRTGMRRWRDWLRRGSTGAGTPAFPAPPF